MGKMLQMYCTAIQSIIYIEYFHWNAAFFERIE